MADILTAFTDNKLKAGADPAATDPLTLDDISEDKGDQNFVIENAYAFEKAELKVDYSDFSNFVFLNSALDYFNITADKILNEYPYDGSRKQLQEFSNDLDPYQRDVIARWPSWSGHLRLSSSLQTYVKVVDIGKEDGITRSGLLNPGSSSFTVEGWYDVNFSASNARAQFLVQKIDSSENGYSVYVTGSSLVFRVRSGSLTTSVSASVTVDQTQTSSGIRYFAAVCDRSSYTGSVSLYTGSQTSFPKAVATSSLNMFGPLYMGSSSFYMGSGSISSIATDFYSGSIDEIRFWKTARTLAQLSSSFNSQVYAQDGLYGLWRFNERGATGNNTLDSIVIDYSGKTHDAQIMNYVSSSRGSGSFIYETPDPILLYDDPRVSSMILEQQTSGSQFDRDNAVSITSYFPQSLFIEETKDQTFIFRNFLFVCARLLDQIKLYTKHFVNLNVVNYTEFDQVPDSLLKDTAAFYGFDLNANFISADAFQYFLGRNIRPNLESNSDLDQKLFSIKNEIWRRILNNLSYIYKTKGTKESIYALLRAHGFDKSIFRLKEYVEESRANLSLKKISSEKSKATIAFGSGSLTGSVYQTVSSYLSGSDSTIELRVRFPSTGSTDITATKLSGTLWTYAADQTNFCSLVYTRDSLASSSGSLFITGTIGTVGLLSGTDLFNGDWHNVSIVTSYTSGTVVISDRKLKNSDIITSTSSSYYPSINTFLASASLSKIVVGSPKIIGVGSTWQYINSQYWAQEFRVWKRALDPSELNDHTTNFQSYGTDNVDDQDKLLEHWRLDSETTASYAAANADQFYLYDISQNRAITAVTGTNFTPAQNVYKKFLFNYYFNASPSDTETDDKVRVYDSSSTENLVVDSQLLTIELNMTDSLNEDIVQMMSSFNELAEVIGTGASRYNERYELDRIRRIYFKRLQGKLNFRLFADMLDFFDRSFLKMIEALVPVSAIFTGDEFVVESHMLERPKVPYSKTVPQQNYMVVEGVINVLGPSAMRFNSLNSVSRLVGSLDSFDDSSTVETSTTVSSIPRSVKG